MSTFSKTPKWQVDRMSILHAAFVDLDRAIKFEGAALVTGLHQASARLDGRDLGGGHQLKAAFKTLLKLWYAWAEGGRKASALKPKYNSPGHVNIMPDLLGAEIQRMASSETGARDKNKGGIEGAAIHKRLCERWKAGLSIPGVGTWQEWWERTHPALPLPNRPPDFPWSVKTVLRRTGPKALRVIGSQGIAAATNLLPHLKLDYSKLRKCELYTLDDVHLDMVAIDDITGKVVDVKAYILIEVSARRIVAFVVKPEKNLRAEDVDELLAHGLSTDGFGLGVGYQTHIRFERGTIACSEAAQLVLEAGSEGALKIHRTSMDGGVKWVGAAADKKSGHAAGKAVIESFNRNLHRRLLHLPGQRGNNWQNAPSNLGAGGPDVKDPSRRSTDTTVARAERLAQFRRTALTLGIDCPLELPLLTVSALQREVATAIKAHNSEEGHGMQGFRTRMEAEVAPGVWHPVNGL